MLDFTLENNGGGGAVDSVNGQMGTVVLDAEDVGALPSDTPVLPLGSLVTSVTPLSQNSLHLLDGSVLSATDYPDFVEYIAGLYENTTEAPNVTIYGSLTNTNNVLSGFSSSNYAELPHTFVHGSSSWEMVFKITTGNDVTTAANICEQFYDGAGTGEYEGFALSLYNSFLNIRCGNGASTFWRATTTNAITANTAYLVKAEFTGTQYILSTSIDNGTTWTVESTLNSSTAASDAVPLRLGARRSNVSTIGLSPWGGTIDLAGCYIKVNNEEYWSGTKYNHASYFASEADWQKCVTAFGNCSQYVFDSDTVRLPKVQFVKDTNSGTAPGAETLIPFNQPFLTANGTVGGSEAACEASDTYSTYYPWQAFDGDSATTWCSSTNTKWITYYNPEPLLVSSVELTFQSANERYTSGTISGSNDNTTWVQIGSFSGNDSHVVKVSTNPNNIAYKYIRFTGSNVAGGNYGQIKQIDISAQVVKPLVYEPVDINNYVVVK